MRKMRLNISWEVEQMSEILENPRGGCVLAGINSVLGAIDRVCPILHSGPGCCMQTTAAEQGQSGNKNSCFVSGVSLPSTNMLEREVVFGGVGKLKTTIQGAIDVIDADAYFVLTGCTAGIIGDDIVSVTEEYREKGYEVYPIDTPGFAGDSNLGYEVIWNNFIDRVIEENVPKDERLVNLFGIVPYHDPFWSGNIEEIARILKNLGLRVNTFFTEHQGIETVRKCSAAALNIIVNPWLFKGPAEKFEEKFGVPYVRYPGLPVGATDTTRFIRLVAEKLNLDPSLVDSVIEKEEDYVYSYLAQAIGTLSWKRFAVVGDANSAVGITRYLANDYSFTPRLTIISEPIFRLEDKERITKELTQLEYAIPPKIVFTADQYEINEALSEDEELTLIVGSSNEREVASVKDIQCIAATFPLKDRLVFNRAYAGYRGSLSLTEDLYDNL
jgi:nitrogenase molybdenum-iron protein beta chain